MPQTKGRFGRGVHRDGWYTRSTFPFTNRSWISSARSLPGRDNCPWPRNIPSCTLLWHCPSSPPPLEDGGGVVQFRAPLPTPQPVGRTICSERARGRSYTAIRCKNPPCVGKIRGFRGGGGSYPSKREPQPNSRFRAAFPGKSADLRGSSYSE